MGLCKLGVLLGGFPNEESISDAYWSNGERADISILVSVMLLFQQLGEHSKTCERPEVERESVCGTGCRARSLPELHKPSTACEHEEALLGWAVR